MKTRVAVVGAGFMGRTHATSYGKAGLEAEVLYIVDSDPIRAESLAASLSPRAKGLSEIQTALDDLAIDAVDICLPTRFHHELCIRSLKAGKHVLCEKPIASNIEEARGMLEAGSNSGKTFMVAHVLRFWPEYVRAGEIIGEGGIGKLRRISCARLSAPPEWSAGNWLLDSKMSGGAVRDLAIHDYDFMNQLAGMPQKVCACGDLMDFTALFRFADGAVGSVHASYALPPGFPFRMSFLILGDKGSLEFDGTGGSLSLVRNGEQETLSVSGSRTFRQNESASDPDGYFYEIAHFVDCVRNGRSPEQGRPEDARDALAIALSVEAALA